MTQYIMIYNNMTQDIMIYNGNGGLTKTVHIQHEYFLFLTFLIVHFIYFNIDTIIHKNSKY